MSYMYVADKSGQIYEIPKEKVKEVLKGYELSKDKQLELYTKLNAVLKSEGLPEVKPGTRSMFAVASSLMGAFMGGLTSGLTAMSTMSDTADTLGSLAKNKKVRQRVFKLGRELLDSWSEY